MSASERDVDAADGRLRVFISSSPGELDEERQAVRAAVRTLRLMPVFHEPGAGVHPLRESDVFVGIYWQSYGWTAALSTLSGIEDEYLRSVELPQLVYVKEPAPARELALRRLLQRMDADGQASRRAFSAPGELAELVIDDLAALVSDRFYGGRTPTRELPLGVVSFVFADMDGSTPLVRKLGDAYPPVLDAFREVLVHAVRANSGAVVDFEGDGAFCAFSDPGDAARAAVSIQRGLRERAWPEGVQVRARIGIHTGEAQRAPGGYVGLEVHRAARIGAAANGGQILVSSATAGMLEDGPVNGWTFSDLGAFSLKGLDRAERLVQLSTLDLEQELPAPRARGASSVRLPVQLTPLVGRAGETARIVAQLADHDIRLVTLTGPGGIGKTRLAVAAAEEVAPAYPDGVYFVPLADAVTEDHVIGITADALGVRGEGARPLRDTIHERLATDRSLLVLDNFERVLEARIVVSALLARCPGVDLLLTSRTPLRLQGEHEFPVPPLPESEAVQLFLDRALATRPAWTPSEDDAAAIVEICRRLEGLPLAIELAASRLRVLDPPSLLERIGERLDVVGGSLPDLPDRQRTLTATIDWSYDFLDEAERAVFARLAVFVDGWTVRAAEAICASYDVGDVLAVLERLVEHSLVVSTHGSAGTPRMRMLATIREYAVAKLEESGELEEMRRRHAAHFDRFVQELRPLFGAGRAAESMLLLDDDWENVYAAVPWRMAARDYPAVVEVASATWRYVWLFDRVREATTWMAEVYEARAELEPALRGELCRLWGSSLYQLGDYPRAKVALEEAVELLAEHGPRDREAWARTIFAGLLPHFEPDLEIAYREVDRAVELFRPERNAFGLATALGIMGTITTLLGRAEEGRAQLQEGVAVAEGLGLPSLIGANRTLQALARLTTGDLEEARALLRDAAGMPLFLEGTAYCLEGLAAVALAEGDPIRAATALGAAEGLRERTGIQMWPVVRMVFEPALEALDRLGPDAERARYEGRRLKPRDALARLSRDM
jgi:predicted ATPase/class 3 adenylate cyclase